MVVHAGLDLVDLGDSLSPEYSCLSVGDLNVEISARFREPMINLHLKRNF